MRKFQWLFIFISGCATLGVMEFDKLYGPRTVLSYELNQRPCVSWSNCTECN
jgi:hypothetical protein